MWQLVLLQLLTITITITSIATTAHCCSKFQIGHFCAFVPQFGSMIHKTQDEPLSLMMSQFVSEFIS